MTVPVPVPEPLPDPRELLKARLLDYGLTAAQVRAALGDADDYAFRMVELHARPDDRWGPQ